MGHLCQGGRALISISANSALTEPSALTTRGAADAKNAEDAERAANICPLELHRQGARLVRLGSSGIIEALCWLWSKQLTYLLL